jgi:hypothetical protein
MLYILVLMLHLESLHHSLLQMSLMLLQDAEFVKQSGIASITSLAVSAAA